MDQSIYTSSVVDDLHTLWRLQLMPLRSESMSSHDEDQIFQWPIVLIALLADRSVTHSSPLLLSDVAADVAPLHLDIMTSHAFEHIVAPFF